MARGIFPYHIGDGVFDRHYGTPTEAFDGKPIHIVESIEFDCDGSHDILIQLFNGVGVDQGASRTYTNKIAVVVGHGSHYIESAEGADYPRVRVNTWKCAYSYDDTMFGICTFYVIED